MILKIMRLCSVIVSAVALTFGVLWQYSNWLDKKLAAYEDVNIERGGGGLKVKCDGLYLLKRALRQGDLLLIGSSELSAPVPQNPGSVFPNSALPFYANRVGHGYRQSLLDGILLGALPADARDKLAVVISLQWFFGEDIDKKGTAGNFSELQLYEFMHNDSIAEAEKRYACERLSGLLSEEACFGEACFYARMQAQDGIMQKIGRFVFYPYYELRYRFLELKDRHTAYKYLKNQKEIEKYIPVVNWQEEYQKAEESGRHRCTNNNLFVYDEYYEKYLKSRWEKLRDSSKNEKLLGSKETGDYVFLLNVIKQKDLSPYIVLMSTNGRYYDYIGLNRERRCALYDYLRNEAEAKGVSYLDLRDKEYEPYFYCDVMHLGWRGWTYVNEQMALYFSKAQ